MSEEIKRECTVENETLKLICEIEKNYNGNFTAQANFLKAIANKAMNFDKNKEIKNIGISEGSLKDPFTFILDFLGRGQEARRTLAKQIGGDDWDEDNKVLFLGIQNLTRAKFAHLKKEADKDCNEDSQNQDIQECLKSIFCETKNSQNCLKDSLDNDSFDKLKKIFANPTATVTSVLYWLYPEHYIPFDENSKKLYEKLELTCDDKKIEIKDDWDCYGKVISALKVLSKDSDTKLFVENGKFKPSMIIALSLAAWHFNNEVDNILSKYINSDKKAKNIILTGIPGTGKTHSIMEFLKQNSSFEYAFVQFHPSYDYEDFIEGFKPVSSTNGQIEFKLVNGIFKDLCKKAFADKKNKTFVMVIDEINRANLSRVFGELLYCLEYRDEFVSTKMTTYIQGLDQTVPNNFSEDEKNIGKFAIPDNVIIIGTMNEVDRSIDAFDLALRRRFIWEDVGFSEMALRLYTPFFTNGFQSHIEDLIKKANDLNKNLERDIGKNYTLGHTYYFKIIDYYDKDFNSALCDLWDYHIKSIVREYCKIKFGENELSTKLEEYKKIIVGDKSNCNG